MNNPNTITHNGIEIPVHQMNTVVVGSGAAGLNCAGRLHSEFREQGVANPSDEIALVTRSLALGTSRNAGSDKQTYYKLGTSASSPDTAIAFAETLTAGGCAHGDIALAEAANSLRSFFNLADLGVPFPHDEIGLFAGYKTDHDPLQRGTSAGPWTSRLMVEKLLAQVERLQIPIFDNHFLLAIVVDDSGDSPGACGVLCVDLSEQRSPHHGLVLFAADNVVVAGGGPGELYERSVYPKNQMGPYAPLFEAGASACNLTECQFGIASIRPRWNLSGSYQQVIPCYYSRARDRSDPQYFLNPFFESMPRLATNIFLKGYQWPFDPEKVCEGSSLVDVLVHREIVERGRRVFMDFRKNPVETGSLGPFSVDALEEEPREYLERSGALQETPIERLEHLNPLAIHLYRAHGIDLHEKPLEIAVCAQHCNGGFVVDQWWESDVPHLFVIGELAGTHGVKRPGGSALNAGQVGGLRAAQRIARVYANSSDRDFTRAAGPVIEKWLDEIERMIGPDIETLPCKQEKTDAQHRMTVAGGMVRSAKAVEEARQQAQDQWQRVQEQGLFQPPPGFLDALEARNVIFAQNAFLEAIAALLAGGAGSRGSYLVADPGGDVPHPNLEASWRFLPENLAHRDEILTVAYDGKKDAFTTGIITPRPIPDTESWFETVWENYRTGSVFEKTKEKEERP